MAGYKRTIYDGQPGDIWVNETGRVQFQFYCQWANSCGVCMQKDRLISTWWPIPIHPNCRCLQKSIAVGAEALPFVDFRKKLDRLDDDQKQRAIGLANYKLVKKGVASWDDAVSSTRLRPFHEVVANLGLDVKQLVKAGIDPRTAKSAFEKVHTTEHERLEQHRRDLVQTLKGAGLNPSQIAGAVARKMPSRVGIAGLNHGVATSSPQRFRPPTQAETLRTLLASGLPLRPLIPAIAGGAPKKNPKPAPTPTPTPAPTPLHQNPQVARALDLASKEGVPVEIRDEAFWRAHYGADWKQVAAAYESSSDKILINADGVAWTDPAKLKEAHAKGYVSTGDPDHVLHHEIGHRKHRHNLGLKDYRDLKQDASRNPPGAGGLVSQYATTNPLEFVAETYAGLRLGKTYPAAIMQAYRDLGGVLP